MRYNEENMDINGNILSKREWVRWRRKRNHTVNKEDNKSVGRIEYVRERKPKRESQVANRKRETDKNSKRRNKLKHRVKDKILTKEGRYTDKQRNGEVGWKIVHIIKKNKKADREKVIRI
jgi:hypothetical protein